MIYDNGSLDEKRKNEFLKIIEEFESTKIIPTNSAVTTTTTTTSAQLTRENITETRGIDSGFDNLIIENRDFEFSNLIISVSKSVLEQFQSSSTITTSKEKLSSIEELD